MRQFVNATGEPNRSEPPTDGRIRLVRRAGGGRHPALVVLGDPIVLLMWLVAVIAVGALDAALAGSPRALRLERSLPSRVRLGETVASTLYLTNTGRRRVHGVVRDGWQPSAAGRMPDPGAAGARPPAATGARTGDDAVASVGGGPAEWVVHRVVGWAGEGRR